MICPVCNSKVITKYDVTALDKKEIEWGHCICGAIFHTKGIDKSFFDEKYLKAWQEIKGLPERFDYLMRVYLPLIEDLTYGRKFLDVGFTLNYHIKNLARRGWVATGIDLIENDYVIGDFEDYKFPDKFDFINFGHCLETFLKPIEAIKKAYDLLDDNGVLMIATPNPEIIFTVGIGNFGHWDYKEKHIFISKQELENIARRVGFDIVLSRRNFSQRFIMYNDLHLILQK